MEIEFRSNTATAEERERRVSQSEKEKQGRDEEGEGSRREGRRETGQEVEKVGGCRTLQGILRPRHYGEQMSNSLNPRVL